MDSHEENAHEGLSQPNTSAHGKMDFHEEKALENVRDFFKTIISTSGIMLALLWGLSKDTANVLGLVRIASILLVVAIFTSLLGCQFIGTELDRKSSQITHQKTVTSSFIVSWIIFLAGCVFVILAIFVFEPRSIPSSLPKP